MQGRTFSVSIPEATQTVYQSHHVPRHRRHTGAGPTLASSGSSQHLPFWVLPVLTMDTEVVGFLVEGRNGRQKNRESISRGHGLFPVRLTHIVELRVLKGPIAKNGFYDFI